MALVTVVIPTYNWATVLPWSIGSVRAQGFTDWELWVIGDGCTDESEAVVADVTAEDPRVRWDNLPANGRSQAGPNNAALKRADGRYMAYLGHDDLWLPEHLELLVEAMEAGAPFAFGRQLRIDPGRAPYLSPPEGYEYVPGDWHAPTSAIHRVDDVRRLGGWRFPDRSGTHDPESDLWARLAEHVGAPLVLDAVTSVKLPASLRGGVYRERPYDEQESWWGRRCQAASSEAFIAGALAEPTPEGPHRYDPLSVPAGLDDPDLPAAERRRRGRLHRGLDA